MCLTGFKGVSGLPKLPLTCFDRFDQGLHQHFFRRSNIADLKGTVSLGNKLFLNSTHLLDINFCANNICSKVFILKKSKIHIRRHFPRIDMGWRPLARVCLCLHASSCLRSTRRRYIVSINMASIKAQHCLSIAGIQIILFLDRYDQIQSQFSWIDIIIFQALFSEINLLQSDTVPLKLVSEN